MGKRIVIIGAGPCGLGAAWRLRELGYENFVILERNEYPGGLATSFRDNHGFLWDIGGHVTFSNYRYYDRVMDTVLPGAWSTHTRRTYVVERSGWIPYPFQNHISHLPIRERTRIISSFLTRPHRHGDDLYSWLVSTFGHDLVERFMRPYNEKVWAYPLDTLSHTWVSERIATPNLTKMLAQIAYKHADRWGPNQTFRYPTQGGTGSIWRAVAQPARNWLRTDAQVTAIDRESRLVHVDGHTEPYDALISTIPAVTLAKLTSAPNPKLSWSSTNVLGFGFEGPIPQQLKGISWLYFPEHDMPAYRATIFSNYSNDHTPDPDRYWSLMCEVSESPHRRIIDDPVRTTLAALERLGLIDPERLVSTWQHREEFGYPTPTIERDRELEQIRRLEEDNIFSRGRFGGWRYEVSNQDHTFMQGVEVVDRILSGTAERTYR